MKNTVCSYRGEYLKQIQRTKVKTLVLQIAIVLGFLGIWQVCAKFKIIDPFIFSSPLSIIDTFIQADKISLFYHCLVTVQETAAGFFIGGALGFLIASALWFFPFLNRALSPFLVVLNSLPKIALGPVIIVWAGSGIRAVITMAVAISLIVTVLELNGGFYQTDENLITIMESFGAKKYQIFFKVVLPYNIPTLFQSLKVNIGLTLVGVIAGEFLASKAGLGYLIVYSGQVFQMDTVMMSVIILCFIAFIMYEAVDIARKIAEKKINHTD